MSDELPVEDPSYGATPIGQWLSGLIQTVGAPEGWPLASDDIVDTGTALELKVEAFAGSLSLFAVAEKPPDLFHDSVGVMTPAGQAQDFSIYEADTGSGRSYLARSDEWQLSVTALPAGDGEVPLSDEAVIDWITLGLQAASQDPPP